MAYNYFEKSPVEAAQAIEKKSQGAPLNDGLVGDAVDSFQAGALSGMGGMFDFVGAEGIAKSLYAWSDDQQKTMSESGRESLSKQFITEDANGDIAIGEGMKDIDTWILTMANVAGQFAGTAVPGGAAARAVTKVANLGSKGGKAAGAIGMGATGGSAATGQGMEQARQEIQNMPDEILADSPMFVGVLKDIHSKKPSLSGAEKWDLAKDEIASRVAQDVRTDPKVLVANFAASAIGDPIIGKALTGARIAKSGALKSALAGTVTEGTTESIQAGVQQYGINEALQPIDNRDSMKGVVAAGLNEGIAGAGFGGIAGGIGGVANRGNTIQDEQPSTTLPDDETTPRIDENEGVKLPDAIADEIAIAPRSEAASKFQSASSDIVSNGVEQLVGTGFTKEQAIEAVKGYQYQAAIKKGLSEHEASLVVAQTMRDKFDIDDPILTSPAPEQAMPSTTQVAQVESEVGNLKSPIKEPEYIAPTSDSAQLDRIASAAESMKTVKAKQNTKAFLEAEKARLKQAEIERSEAASSIIADTTNYLNASKAPSELDNNQSLQQQSATQIKQTPQKDIVFAGNESGVNVAKNGEAFKTKRDALLSKEARAARRAGQKTKAVSFDNGFGWTIKGDDGTKQDSEQAAAEQSPESDTVAQNEQGDQAQPAQQEGEALSLNVDAEQVSSEENKNIAGEMIDDEWQSFTKESGTKNIPRSEMPQIKAENRGAMVNFMKARDIGNEKDEVQASSLKPTQQEFSPAKVKQAKEFEGGSRSILVSNDDYILDGHHQWLAAREKGETVKVTRLNAPIEQLVPLAKEMPSTETQDNAGNLTATGNEETATTGKLNSDSGKQSEQKAVETAETGKLIEQEPATTEQQAELPPILKTTKRKWLQSEAKKLGIKKGSPGYDAAVAKIEESYEPAIDKALAESSFETYQEFNSDTPESINRQAYNELRKEFGYDKAPPPDAIKPNEDAEPPKSGFSLPETLNADGMTADEIEAVINKTKNELANTKTEDWGNLRGQGKRTGGMVMGGMRDSSLQGEKSYLNPIGKLEDVNKADYDDAIATFNDNSMAKSAYGKARSAGFDHDTSLRYGLSKVADIGMTFSELLKVAKQKDKVSEKPANNKSSTNQATVKQESINDTASETEINDIANELEIETTDKSVKVFGDPEEIRAKLRASGIDFLGADIEGGLSFGKKQEQRIRAAIEGDNIELFSKSKKPSNGKSISIKQAQRVADQFIKGLKGANGIKISILQDTATAEKLWRMSLDGATVKGAYSELSKTVYIIAENIDNLTDLKQTLAHETIAHGGLDTVIGKEAKQEFLNRIKATKGRKAFEGLWREVNKDYWDASLDVKVEEMFARFVENEPSKGELKYWWNALKRWIKAQLDKAGIMYREDDELTAMRDMLESIVKGFKAQRETAEQQQGGIALSSKKNKPSDNGDSNESEQYRKDLAKAMRSLRSNPQMITLGKTPKVLRLLGAPDLSLQISRDTIKKATNGIKHAVGMDVIANLPEHLSDPIAVFKSKTHGKVLLIDAVDNNNNPIIAAVHFEKKAGRNLQINNIASVYGKDNADSALKGFELEYLNEGKNPALVRLVGLQLSRSGSPSQGLSKNVLTKEDIVKENPDISFSRTANNDTSPAPNKIAGSVKKAFTRDRFEKSSVPEWDALNAQLRETDKTAGEKIKRQLSRWFMPGGNMPETVQQAKRGRDRDVAVHEFDVSMLVGKLNSAMKSAKINPDRLTDAQWSKYHEFLTGENDGQSLKQSERETLILMREHIDGLTQDYVASVNNKLQQRFEEDGSIDPKESARLEKMLGNMGKYLNRSYKAFDDPKWFEKIPTKIADDARAYLMKQYKKDGATAKEAQQKAQVTMNEMVKTGTAYDSLGSFIAESKLGSKDLSTLIPRKDIAPEIRALLGEYIDPRVNYAKSVSKMSAMIANDKLLSTIRDMGINNFIFEKDDRPPNATVQLAGEKSEVYAPLNGMWTTPEIKEAFEDAMGGERGEGWLEKAIRLNGLIKYGKTVLSPTTAMRNVMSAYFFTVANGHFNQKYMKQAVAAFNAQVKEKVTDGESDYIKRLIKLGVLYDSANAGDIVKVMTDGKINQMLEGRSNTGFDGLNKLADKTTENLRWLTAKATGFYRFGDDFWKIVGFENEKAALIRTGMAESDAEVVAAERIQDTYPTYSRVGKAGAWLSRFPLAGTFVSFPAEIIRTTGNMMKLAASEIKSDNPKIRAMGAKRIVGMSLASGGMFALSALSAAMFGVTDDEEEALRDLAPPWQKNSTFVYAGRDSDNNLRYFDMSFLDPYAYWKRPIEAMMRDQPVNEAIASSLSDMVSPFLGTDITTSKILEVLSNKKSSGGQVYKENDTAIRKSADIASHLALGLAPGFVNNAWRIGMAAGDVKRSTGKPYSLSDEMLALAGFRSSTFDPKVGLYYRTFDFNSAIAEARKELSGVLRDPNKVSDSEISAAKARAKTKQEQAFKQMSRLIKAAQTGGASRRQVVQILFLAGISKRNVGFLLREQVPPVNLSDRSFESAVKRAQLIMDNESAREVRSRFNRIIKND